MDFKGRTIFVADANRDDGKKFVARLAKLATLARRRQMARNFTLPFPYYKVTDERTPQNMKAPSTPSGSILRAQSQGPNQKRKPPSKTKYRRFDTLVGRYYPAVYSFASRLTDDPREAVLLTYDAFNTIRNRRWRRLNEVMLATILLNAVIVAGLKAA